MQILKSSHVEFIQRCLRELFGPETKSHAFIEMNLLYSRISDREGRGAAGGALSKPPIIKPPSN